MAARADAGLAREVGAFKERLEKLEAFADGGDILTATREQIAEFWKQGENAIIEAIEATLHRLLKGDYAEQLLGDDEASEIGGEAGLHDAGCAVHGGADDAGGDTRARRILAEAMERVSAAAGSDQ